MSSVRCLFGDIREASLSNEREDRDKVSVHADWIGKSEKGEQHHFQKHFHISHVGTVTLHCIH